MKTTKYLVAGLLAAVVSVSPSCVKLDPQPLSFFAPENTYTNKEGLQAALVTCAKQIKWEWTGDAFPGGNGNVGTPLVFEYAWSDISVIGAPESKEVHNLTTQLTPNTNENEILRYWNLGWTGIKYANTVISRAKTATGFASEEERNAVLAEGYFHRAYWYYLLVHQWGDVPLILEEITSPKLDFYTSSRTRILKQMREDMEFAVQWLPQSVPSRSLVSRAAGEHLLTKIYLSLGEFQKAVDAATRVINENGLALMRNRFGVNKGNAGLDVFNDLFKEDNISLPENSEAIYVVQERFGMLGTSTGNSGSKRMRNFVPYWSNGGAIKTPDGKNGTLYDINQPGKEQGDMLGRGIAKIRPTNYSQYDIWENAGSDIRHNDNNWFDIYSRLVYNCPPAKGGSATWYGKTVQKQYVSDTFRCYFSFPTVKVLVYKDDPDYGKAVVTGGFTDSYVFRLAETYLLRAEAYWWLGNGGAATQDVNEIRTRAQAEPLANATLEDIFDERARELYLEEHRKSELTRIAFIKAQLGQDGYSRETFGVRNWYHDRVMAKNNFFKTQYKGKNNNAFVMEPYHVLWPVPYSAIRSNTMGHINQNYGYDGYETNIPPIE